MNMKPIVAVAIALTVGIVTFSGVLIPAIESGVDTEDTFTNRGAFYVELDPTDSYRIQFNNSVANNVITVNGTQITLDKDYTIVALENAILRYNSTAHKLDWNGNSVYLMNINVLDLTISAGSITGTYTTTGDSTTFTSMTYTKCYVISPTKQTLVMSEYSVPVTIKGDSDIVAFGRTVLSDNGTNKQYLIQIEGTIDDGVDVTVCNVSSGADIGATITDLSINYAPVQGYEDLYKLNSITFKASVTENDTATNVTFSAYIVPTEVTAEKSIHADATTILLFQTIPVFIVLGMIVAVVGVLYLKSRR